MQLINPEGSDGGLGGWVGAIDDWINLEFTVDFSNVTY